MNYSKDEKTLIEIEKKIRGKMTAIKNNTLTPKDSNIGVLLNSMKTNDEALYNTLMAEYKIIIKNLTK